MTPTPPRDPCKAPPMTFGAFITSLAQSALVHLGEVEHPDQGRLSADLPLARQTIDLLEVLECKTRGNLEEEEARLLSAVLYDLRVKYLAHQKGA